MRVNLDSDQTEGCGLRSCTPEGGADGASERASGVVGTALPAFPEKRLPFFRVPSAGPPNLVTVDPPAPAPGTIPSVGPSRPHRVLQSDSTRVSTAGHSPPLCQAPAEQLQVLRCLILG